MNHSARSVIEVANELMPQPEPQWDRPFAKRHRDAVIAGCAFEIPIVSPSNAEIGEIIGLSHTCVKNQKDDWFAMRWNERYAWLKLVEGRLGYEKNPLDAALL